MEPPEISALRRAAELADLAAAFGETPGVCAVAPLGESGGGPGTGGGLPAPDPAPGSPPGGVGLGLEGGQVTISPPSKVKCEDGQAGRVLAFGIDSLVLAIDVKWENDSFFCKLAELKALAIKNEREEPGEVRYADNSDGYLFNVSRFGKKGYEWLLAGQELSFEIGAWLEPISRPSLMVEVRSEALWRFGPRWAIARIGYILHGAGAKVQTIKVSRVDLNVDIVLPEGSWSIDLMNRFVTRAADITPHFHHGRLTGFSLGKGAIHARLYDKPFEIICKQGKKLWMFDVWGLREVPEGHRIIRVEFQLRRQALKQLDIDSDADLFRLLRNLWAYCTQKWLKVQTDASQHHTMRKNLPWWDVVQAGFYGVQEAHPCIRAKAVSVDKKQTVLQLLGQLTRLLALESSPGDSEAVDLAESLVKVHGELEQQGVDDATLGELVRGKLAKLQRAADKYQDANLARKELGLSGNGR